MNLSADGCAVQPIARSRQRATPSAHNPEVCGIYPETDCDDCQAARRAEAEDQERAESQRLRTTRQRHAVDRLAIVAGVTSEELPEVFLQVLRDQIIDIAVTAAEEVTANGR